MKSRKLKAFISLILFVAPILIAIGCATNRREVRQEERTEQRVEDRYENRHGE